METSREVWPLRHTCIQKSAASLPPFEPRCDLDVVRVREQIEHDELFEREGRREHDRVAQERVEPARDICEQRWGVPCQRFENFTIEAFAWWVRNDGLGFRNQGDGFAGGTRHRSRSLANFRRQRGDSELEPGTYEIFVGRRPA